MQVFTSLLVLGIVFGVFIVTDLRSYKQRKENAMMSLAQVTSTNSISMIQFQDNEAAKEMLSGLQSVSPDIISSAITDSSGKIFAVSVRQGVDSFQIPQGLKDRKTAFINHHLYVRHDIIQNGRTLGTVYLVAGLADLREIKKMKYGIALTLLLLAIVVSFLIGFLIQSYISKRLLNLVATMKEVSKTNDYTRNIAGETGKDEIGTLIRVFNNLLQQVNENQKKKDEFIGIASHELRTPLTSIKGYVEMLHEMETKEPNKFLVQKAFDNVNKLEKLIKDLLDVSKIQRGQLELTMRDFNLGHLIDETIAAFQMVAPSHEIIRSYDLENTIVHGDRQRIEQVLTNLLSNAIKYSPEGKKVIVSSNQTNSEVMIKIRDFGYGVPEAEQSEIFERFYRTKNTSITISGFGLGLYICRDIISRHHGKIGVGIEDKGSTFYFTLPLKSLNASLN